MRWLRIGCLIVVAAAVVACKKTPAVSEVPAAGEEVASANPPATTNAEPRAPAPPATIEPRVVVVTIDGVRWQDLFVGPHASLAKVGDIGGFDEPATLAPHLHELARSGVAFGGPGTGCGVVRARGTSNVSLPGYFEILGGRATRCQSNVCPRPTQATVLDDAAGAGIAPVASISSWELLDRAATVGASGVVAAAGTRPWPAPLDPSSRLADLVERGSRLPPFPAPGGAYRPDSSTTSIALEYLRTEAPRLLHVGLGDPDEFGHRGDYGAYLASIHEADAFVGDLVALLDDDGSLPATTILVTTDHGRAADFRSHGALAPESRRSFVFAFGRGIASPGARCASRDIELPDIGATIRALLGLPRDEDPSAGIPIEEIAGSPSER